MKTINDIKPGLRLKGENGILEVVRPANDDDFVIVQNGKRIPMPPLNPIGNLFVVKSVQSGRQTFARFDMVMTDSCFESLFSPELQTA